MIVESVSAAELRENSIEFGSRIKEDGVTKEIWDKLRATDLFRAPASTQYHSVFVGGLVDHCLGVDEWFQILRERLGVPKNPKVRTHIVALFHDLCKVNVYFQEMMRKKIDGRWVDVQGWVFKEDYPMGHGEKSVAMCEEFGIELTREEKLCIRHHMGPYELSGIPLKTYQEAVKVLPEVFLLHTADMLEATYGRPTRLEGSKNVGTVPENEEGP